MTKPQEFPALYSHRNKSVLPEHTQDACYGLGKAIRSNSVDQIRIDRLREVFQDIAAEAISQASREIREIAQIYQAVDFYQPQKRVFSRFLCFRKPSRALEQLAQYPSLGWLLLFHGNGFARQAALEALLDAPQCPFEFSAIVYRLNDWVGDVRQAAVEYCNRQLANAPAEVVAESAFYLLHQARLLNRWDGDGQQQLEDAIYRPDVVQHLKSQFLGVRAGRVGHTFKQILRRSEFDQHLVELATDATLPSVRAIATDTLLMRRAQWLIGHKKEWVDKRFGISRRVTVLDSRPVDVTFQSDSLLEKAAQDRSAQVRKVAADALIVRRHEASDNMDRIAQHLITDSNLSVRSRADFYLRNKT